MATLVCNARERLQRFPKDVVIEAFLRTVAFFSAHDVIAECETIQRDNKFKSLMTRGEEISEQITMLLKSQPKAYSDEYSEWLRAVQQCNHEQDIIQNKVDKLLGI